MRAQVLDSMELERERGITIKAQAVRVSYRARDGETYQLHLIDTPGHVDFSYEVSRSLAACEGAVLVVDASQGVEAQTLANTYLAVEAGLELIPALNKIDLPGAEPERVADEIADLLGEPIDDILLISGKTGAGVDEVLERIVERVPPPGGDVVGAGAGADLRLEFDQYRGVVAYVRVVDGVFRKGEAIRAMVGASNAEIDEIGFFSPQMRPTSELRAGEVGYVITGHQGRHAAARRRHADEPRAPRERAAARLPRGQADGLLRPLPDRLRALPGAARRAREADAQRRRAVVGAGELGRARLRLPRRLPRPAAHGHRARAARARVRPRAADDDAVGALRGDAHQRRGGRGPQPLRHARPGR